MSNRNTEKLTLEAAEERFLSLCLSQALEADWLSPSDLYEKFPPLVLMQALEAVPELRAKLLIDALGVHPKLASKKSTSAAAEELGIALEEGICEPAQLVAMIGVEHHVRLLKQEDLWELLTRDEFWLDNGERSQTRMGSTLTFAIEQGLLTLRELVQALSPESLVADLPRNLLQQIVIEAIKTGQRDAIFEPEHLFAHLPFDTWLQHVPLVSVWQQVVTDIVLTRIGRHDGGAQKTSPLPPPSEFSESVNVVAPASQDGSFDVDFSADVVIEPSEDEPALRKQALNELRKRHRLPKSWKELSAQALIGLAAMYKDLKNSSSDDARQECILASFSNQEVLTEALLALAETLDPRLSKEELLARGADTTSLIMLVLFEERRSSSKPQAVKHPVSSFPPPSRTVARTPSAPPPRAIAAPGVPAAHPTSVPPPLPQRHAKHAGAPPRPMSRRS